MQPRSKFKIINGIVNLSYSDINDDDAKELYVSLVFNPNVRGLNLEGNHLTDKGAAILATLNLNYLNLNNNPVSDITAMNIASNPNLREVYLQSTRITDVGVMNLAMSTSIMILNLKNMVIGKNGMDQLSKSRSINVVYTDAHDIGGKYPGIITQDPTEFTEEELKLSAENLQPAKREKRKNPFLSSSIFYNEFENTKQESTEETKESEVKGMPIFKNADIYKQNDEIHVLTEVGFTVKEKTDTIPLLSLHFRLKGFQNVNVTVDQRTSVIVIKNVPHEEVIQAFEELCPTHKKAKKVSMGS